MSFRGIFVYTDCGGLSHHRKTGGGLFDKKAKGQSFDCPLFYIGFDALGKHVNFYRFGAEEAALTIGFKEQIY